MHLYVLIFVLLGAALWVQIVAAVALVVWYAPEWLERAHRVSKE